MLYVGWRGVVLLVFPMCISRLRALVVLFSRFLNGELSIGFIGIFPMCVFCSVSPMALSISSSGLVVPDFELVAPSTVLQFGLYLPGFSLLRYVLYRPPLVLYIILIVVEYILFGGFRIL